MSPSQRRKPARRDILAIAAAGTAATLLPQARSRAAAAIALPTASSYPHAAFEAHDEASALQAMFGTPTATISSDVRMQAPDIAENGAVVPVKFDANASKITAAAILARDNPYTLACAYKLPPGTSPAISSRIKLAKTTHVVAVIQSDGKLLTTTKRVKVTLGGCG